MTTMYAILYIHFVCREVLIERQWRGRSCRQACDFFWEQVNQHDSREEVPPVMSNVNSFLISIYRDGNFLLVTTTEDTYALFVIEFLHRVYDVFEEYFRASRDSLGALGSLGGLANLSLARIVGDGGETAGSSSDGGGAGASGTGCILDEGVIKDHFSVIYSLLEELVDFGFPLTTELNALKEIIEPPSLLTKLRGAVRSSTGMGIGMGSPAAALNPGGGGGGSSIGIGIGSSRFSEPSPDGTLANMPWRKCRVTHANNEVYFDIVEELDCLIDDSGNNSVPVASSAYGSIMCNSKLSGVPDLCLSLLNAGAIADCSFHPCVRLSRFERDQVLSFVPPDGVFELMRYRVDPGHALRSAGGGVPNPSTGPVYEAPLNCQAHIIWDLSKTHPTARLAVTLTHLPRCSLVTASIVSGQSPARGGSSGSLFGLGSEDGGGGGGGSHRNKLPVEDIIVAVPLPPRLVQTLTSVTAGGGTTLFDEHSKTLRWRVPKLVPDKPLSLTAVLSLRGCEHALVEPLGAAGTSSTHLANSSNAVLLTAADVLSCHVQWKVPMATLSGIAVQGLSLVNENYKPFKGVRTLTKSGHMEVRMASILAT
jgi:AP-3 complex subunit mu